MNRFAAVTAVVMLLTAACSGGDDETLEPLFDQAPRIEVPNPETGELEEVELVQPEPWGGTVRDSPDTSHEWPDGYLNEIGWSESDMDEWSRQRCVNLTDLPEPAVYIGYVMVVPGPDDTATVDRRVLMPTLIRRWCPDFSEFIDEAEQLMATNPIAPPEAPDDTVPRADIEEES